MAVLNENVVSGLMTVQVKRMGRRIRIRRDRIRRYAVPLLFVGAFSGAQRRREKTPHRAGGKKTVNDEEGNFFHPTKILFQFLVPTI